MKKPIIGISTSFYTVESGVFSGMERAYVNKDYVDAVEKAGGVPLLLPSVENTDSVLRLTELCDGFIFSGGIDVNPLLFNRPPHPALGQVNTRMDRAHLLLVRTALQTGKPILAICRGHQLLNIACGGTLYQDLSEMPGAVFRHSQLAPRADEAHMVTIVKDSILGKLFGESLAVNSFHHQTICDLGAGLRPIATAGDGVIEAVELTGRPFVVGIQWHPEMSLTQSDTMLPVFKAFTEASTLKVS